MVDPRVGLLLLQALIPLFTEEEEGVLLAVWTAAGAATAAVPKVRLAHIVHL